MINRMSASKRNVFEVRGEKVMLDQVISTTLGISAVRLNDVTQFSSQWNAVGKKGIEAKYRFQLTQHETENLKKLFRCKMAYIHDQQPWVYTELGCNFLGTSLPSDLENAYESAIDLVNVFQEYKNDITQSANIGLLEKIDTSRKNSLLTLSDQTFKIVLENVELQRVLIDLQRKLKKSELEIIQLVEVCKIKDEAMDDLEDTHEDQFNEVWRRVHHLIR